MDHKTKVKEGKNTTARLLYSADLSVFYKDRALRSILVMSGSRLCLVSNCDLSFDDKGLLS